MLKMEWIKGAFSIALAVMTALPVVMMNHQKNQVSELDNKVLQEWNDSSFDPNDIDGYINDRIGFRDEAINAEIAISDRLFGELVHPLYTYGQNGYVFFKIDNDTNKVSASVKEFIQTFTGFLYKVQTYCEERDVPFLYCVNPSKTSVYTQYLPKGYVYDNEFLRSLYEHLDIYGIHYITNETLLKERALSEQVYNVKFDAGHWNDLGEFYATNHMLDEISKTFAAVSTHKKEDFFITTETVTKLPLSNFAISEEIEHWNLVSKDTIQDTQKYDGLKLNKNYNSFAYYRKTGTNEDLPRILFFHGSYYNRNREFYKSAFAETYAVHNYQNFIDFDYYFNIFQPECVILETAEYATTASYFSLGNLKAKTLNPAFDNVKEQEHVVLDVSSIVVNDIGGGTLGEITYAVEGVYRYGYLETAEHVLDLEMQDGTLRCVFDKERVDLSKMTIHLFV